MKFVVFVNKVYSGLSRAQLKKSEGNAMRWKETINDANTHTHTQNKLNT